MTVSISIVLILLATAWALHRFAGMRIWHGVVCALLGVYLGTTKAGPFARDIVASLVGFLVTLVH